MNNLDCNLYTNFLKEFKPENNIYEGNRARMEVAMGSVIRI